MRKNTISCWGFLEYERLYKKDDDNDNEDEWLQSGRLSFNVCFPIHFCATTKATVNSKVAENKLEENHKKMIRIIIHFSYVFWTNQPIKHVKNCNKDNDDNRSCTH